MRTFSLPKITALALTALVAGAGVSTSASAGGHSCAALNSVDPDADGSMNIIEALRAGKATFRKLNTDGDRTIEMDELGGRLSHAAFAAANPDGDGSLDIFEWKRLVIARFRRANTDGDITIECDELATPAGRALLRVLR